MAPASATGVAPEHTASAATDSEGNEVMAHMNGVAVADTLVKRTRLRSEFRSYHTVEGKCIFLDISASIKATEINIRYNWGKI